MRTGTPDLLPLFRSEFQIRLLALLLLQPEQAWTIPEMAERLGAPISSAHRELRRAERAGIVDRDSGSRPHRFRAAQESPLYEPLVELLELAVGAEGAPSRAPEQVRDAGAGHGTLADLVNRVVQIVNPPICQRVIGGISPRKMVTGVLRRAWNLTSLGR